MTILSDPLVAIRAVHFAAAAMLTGAVFFRFVVAGPTPLAASEAPVLNTIRRALLWITWSSLAVAIVSGIVWLVLLTMQITGYAFVDVLSGNYVLAVLTGTQFGDDWQARFVIAVLLAASLALLDCKAKRVSSVIEWCVVMLTACFIGALAWAGHAAATGGLSGGIHRAADVLHLIAAGTWLGGLVPLAILFALSRGAVNHNATVIVREATLRFSVLGVVSVGTLLATGIINTWFLAGSVPAMVGTDYGRLLLIKIALFIAMVCIAAVNRLRLTPRLSPMPERSDDYANALRQLERNSLIEVAIGCFILVIVGVLGTTWPGLHAQPSWPFPVRFDDDVFFEDEFRAKAMIALATTAIGVLLVIEAALLRRFRWPMIIVGVAIIGYFARDLRLFTVEAFPTSFYASLTGYSARSIAQGHRLFTEHCAVCHGSRGRGDGVAGKNLKKLPSDLTAGHIYDHLDGDLFWWITNGIDDVMPGFAAAIDEEGRWNLIDFIRANADAVRLQPGQVTAFPAPDISAECADGSVVSIGQLRGHIIHLVFAGSRSRERLDQLAHIALAGDIRTIVVNLDAVLAERSPFCVANDPDTLNAFMLYRGGAHHEMAGTEFFIDAMGQLRSMWYPGAAPDWYDADVLKEQIAQIRKQSAPLPFRRIHGHGHSH